MQLIIYPSTILFLIAVIFSFSDYTGYITEVTDLLTSRESGNHYFDIRVKTSPKDIDTIRIMSKQNPNIRRNLFQEKKNASQPVKLTNVTKVENGPSFFNSNRGSRIHDISAVSFSNTPIDDLKLINIKDKYSGTYALKGCIKWVNSVLQVDNGKTSGSDKAKFVRDGILADDTYHLPISVWGETIDKIEEGSYYKLTHIGTKSYYGQKLYTRRETQVIPMDDADAPIIDWDNIDLNPPPVTPRKQPSNQLTATGVSSLKLSFYPICTSAKCQKKIVVLPGDDILECGECGNSMLIEKRKESFDAVIQFENDGSNTTLTAFPDILTKYFKENVIAKYKEHPQALKKKILQMENILVSYNSKRIITNIADISSNK